MNRIERLDDLEEGLRVAIEAALAQTWTAIPAIIEGVNLAAQTLTAQPAIQGIITDTDGAKQFVTLPLLVDVPIVWPRGGGFALTFPLSKGDEVLVVFASRCIDAWWQSGGIGAQAEIRMHDLSDGFAVLAPSSQPRVLGSISATSVQLRDDAGTTYVEVAPSGVVRIIGAASLDLIAPTINLQGQVNITGQVTQTGGGMNIGGITFASHKHIGVDAGSDTSGVATN